MPFYEREEAILNVLMERESISVRELSGMLYVSVPTLRRDLIKLEQKGRIIRTHGGAQLLKKAGDQKVPFLLREQEQNSAKNIMAQRAAELIKDGDVIMLDSSTSVCSIVPLLPQFNNIIVITSSAKASYVLGELGITNICTGGRMIPGAFGYVGEDAERTVMSYNADIVFFSCRGLTMDGRLTDNDTEENSLRRAMFRQSARRVCLCDSTKFDHIYLNSLCHISEVDELICEVPVPAQLQAMTRGGRNV